MKAHRSLPNDERRRLPLVPRLLATSLGAGFLPAAPGTWGALVGVILWLPLYLWSHQPIIFIITLGALIAYTIAGTWASGEAEKVWGKDPVWACADETVGQWVALLPLAGLHDDPEGSPWWLIIVSFVLFRAFDMFKPLGIRRLENLPGGYGMMADDIGAGLLAFIIVCIIQWIVI